MYVVCGALHMNSVCVCMVYWLPLATFPNFCDCVRPTREYFPRVIVESVFLHFYVNSESSTFRCEVRTLVSEVRFLK